MNRCLTLYLSSRSFSWLLILLLYDYLSMCGYALMYVQDTNWELTYLLDWGKA